MITQEPPKSMNVQFINPFIAATVSVFDSMLGCKLVRRDVSRKRDKQPRHEVSGVIGLSGRAQGTVVLGLSREAAISATEALLQERPSGINREVTDAIGELVNIIAGNAKAQLESLQMSVSLPSVITGKCHCVDFPSKVQPISILFTSPWGDVSIEVGLCESGSGEAAA
jgi:chemotaxis protein CheX